MTTERVWNSWEEAFQDYWESEENDLRGLICIDAAKDLFMVAFRMGGLKPWYSISMAQIELLTKMIQDRRQEIGPVRIRDTQERED